MTLFLWQSTALVNAGADPNVNWAEGQSPATVNNSARAMMAAFAAYRDDMAAIGVLEPPEGSFFAGSFAGTSSQNFSVLGPSSTTLNDHQIFTIVPQSDCHDSPVLYIDNFGPIALVNASGNAIIEGQLQAFCPYLFRYKQSDNKLYLENPPQDLDQSVPVGAVMLYAGNSVPNPRFAFCNGQALSQITYATLFSLIGSTYGVGGGDEDGDPTFMLPDIEAMTIVGERTSSGAIPRASTLFTTAGNATVNGTVIGWTIVLPYIMRII